MQPKTPTSSAPLPAFDPPAEHDDFTSEEAEQRAQFLATWSSFMQASTEIAITGDPWQSLDDQNRSFYFNPLTTSIPDDATPAAIEWNAFPGRLIAYFGSASPSNLTDAQLDELADTGKVAAVPAFASGFPNIPSKVCPTLDWSQPPSQWRTFGPPGPRGWLDEYCEWSVTRNAAGKITSVSFTCENPEYWFTLWQSDPAVVLRLYQQYINPEVVAADLYLEDAAGNPVKNPLTGDYAYNPLNKWNTGTTVGAMHLTSPPNTVGAEIYLAAAATIARPDSSETDPQSMVCCSQYGQPFRNSDPHIGFSANAFIYQQGKRITLANPIGLYIQSPNFASYTLPATAPPGTTAANFWTVVRGRLAQPGTTYDQILRATFAVPESLGFTVSDIQISGAPIQWAAQIARTFNIGLAALALPGTTAPTQYACPTPTPPASTNLWPQIVIDDALLTAYLAAVGIPALPPAPLAPGQSVSGLTLLCAGTTTAATTISFPDGGIRATVTRTYTVDGMTAFVLDLTVAADAAEGLRSVLVTTAGVPAGPPTPGLLRVVAPASTPAPTRLVHRYSRNH